MRIVSLIMAGGRGRRFGGDIEKPMIRLLGKPLIRKVIEATKTSRRISETYVAVTSHNPKTAEEAAKASAKIIETKGRGYHADLREAVLKLNLTCPVLTISSDLPLLNAEFLDEIIDKYEKSRKAALTVLVPIEACQKYGIKPSSFETRHGGKFAVSGINIVDGRKILKGEQETVVLLSERIEAVFNINTPKNLELARNYLLCSGKS